MTAPLDPAEKERRKIERRAAALAQQANREQHRADPEVLFHYLVDAAPRAEELRPLADTLGLHGLLLRAEERRKTPDPKRKPKGVRHVVIELGRLHSKELDAEAARGLLDDTQRRIDEFDALGLTDVDIAVRMGFHPQHVRRLRKQGYKKISDPAMIRMITSGETKLMDEVPKPAVPVVPRLSKWGCIEWVPEGAITSRRKAQ